MAAESALLQGLEAAAVGPLRWGRIPQQVLRYPHREPQGEDALAARAPAGLGKQAEQRGRRRIPTRHASAARKASSTIAVVISFMHR
jgi:hypothetical protein